MRPSWLREAGNVRLWWICGFLSLLAALSESAVGLWLRRVSLQVATSWFWGLAGLLLLRLLLSAARDLGGERLSLQSAVEVHARRWQTGSPTTPEDLQLIEAGTRAALQLRTGVVSLLLLLPAMALIAPRLAACALITALALGAASRRRSEALRKLSHADAQSDADFHAKEAWARRALPEVEAENLRTSLFRKRRRDALQRLSGRLHRASIWQLYQSLLEAAAHVASLGLCGLAFSFWKGGTLSLGQFLAFLALALLAYRPAREAGRALPICLRARELPVPPSPSVLQRGDFLELDEVSFAYPAKPSVLRGISLRLPPGSVALLHGPNGCGKSTLLRLCAGNLAPETGSLRVPTGVLHWVDQETVLPPFSLRHWTRLKQPPDTGAVAHFRRRYFDPFLPGWDWQTEIADGGSRLSRGQRIRLRLLVLACFPGALWLLDEPLSALPRPERWEILEALLACRQGATVLIADQELPDLPTLPLFVPEGQRQGPEVRVLT